MRHAPFVDVFSRQSPTWFIVHIRNLCNKKTTTNQPLPGPFFRGTSLVL